MRLIDTSVLLKSRFDPFVVVVSSDHHFGANGFDRNECARCFDEIRYMKQQGVPVVAGLGGDMVNGILRQDSKRFDVGAVPRDLLVTELRNHCSREAKGFADMARDIGWAWVGSGNHEEEVEKRHSYHPGMEIATLLGAPFTGYSCHVRVQICTGQKPGRWNKLLICQHHGWGGGRSRGAKINRAEVDLPKFAARNTDMYFFSHVHILDAWVKHSYKMITARDMLLAQTQLAFAVTGGFLKTFELNDVPLSEDQHGISAYSERAGYETATLGTPYFTVRLKEIKARGPNGKKGKVCLPTFKPGYL